jgi:hypothetical protein
MEEHLLSKCEALCSSPSTAKHKRLKPDSLQKYKTVKKILTT